MTNKFLTTSEVLFDRPCRVEWLIDAPDISLLEECDSVDCGGFYMFDKPCETRNDGEPVSQIIAYVTFTDEVNHDK